MHPFAQLTLTRRAALLSAAALPLFGLPVRAGEDKGWRKTYGLSSFGDLNLPENFANFPYAKPGAPRGGHAEHGGGRDLLRLRSTASFSRAIRPPACR